MDVGANAGYFSLIWASLNLINKVLTFEASTRNVTLLKDNIEMNTLQDQIKLFPKVLGKESGILPFDLRPVEQTGCGGGRYPKSKSIFCRSSC